MEAWMILGSGIIVSLIATLIQKKFTDLELVKSLKAEVKKLNQEIKKNRGDIEKANQLMKKSFEVQKKIMKITMKPTFISSLVFFPALIGLGYFYGLPLFFGDYSLYFGLPFSLPIVGTQMPWIGVFIVTTIIFSFIFRKVFDLGM